MTVQPHERPRASIDAGAAPPDPWHAAGAADRRLTEAQLTAIRTAMEILRDDDLLRGVSPNAVDYCAGCDDRRPLAGFIRYGAVALCNDCATEYEVVLTSGAVTDVEQFLQDRPVR